MPTSDYLPTSDSDLLVWFDNFRLKFPTYGPTLGFTAAEVTAVTTDYNTLAFVIQAAEAVRTESQSRVNYKNVLRNGPLGTAAPPPPTSTSLTPPATIASPGIVPRLRATAQRIKAHPDYSESIGIDLGLVASTSGQVVKTPATAKPSVIAIAEPGSTVRINWVKAGFDGVQVEGQRAGETVWTFLAVDTQSPYLDTRTGLQPGVPEIRQYRLRYLKNDEPVGAYSDVLTVTTTP